MHVRRLAAASAAVGAVALGLGAMAAPASAAAPPVPGIKVSPNPFAPGAKLSLLVTNCATEPETGPLNQIFTAAPNFTKQGDAFGAVAQSKKALKPGQTYRTDFTCKVDDAGNQVERKFFLTTKIPSRPQPPKFDFGFDDVVLSTRTVKPGGSITFKVRCPTTVTATSASWAKVPAFKKTGKMTSVGTGTFKSDLPSVVNIKVTCKGFRSVNYSTKPDTGKVDNGGSTGKIPSGPGPQTGDGSLLMHDEGGSSAMPFVAGGSAAALAAAGLGVVLMRRRKNGEEQA